MWRDGETQCVFDGGLNLGENNPQFELYVTGTLQKESFELKDSKPPEEPGTWCSDSTQMSLGTQKSNMPPPQP